MGRVTEGKSRARFSADPNNFGWARNEASIGRRILRSHGWEEGRHLGARDPAHPDLLAASTSHIRTRVRDGGVGLGFGPAGLGLDGTAQDRHPGMDVLEEVLARLNGRSEGAIAEERARRDEERRQNMAARKYGVIRFVSAGFLVGAGMSERKAEAGTEGEGSAQAPLRAEKAAAPTAAEEGNKPKERKRKQRDDERVDEEAAVARKKKRKGEKGGRVRMLVGSESSASPTLDTDEQSPPPASGSVATIELNSTATKAERKRTSRDMITRKKDREERRKEKRMGGENRRDGGLTSGESASGRSTPGGSTPGRSTSGRSTPVLPGAGSTLVTVAAAAVVYKKERVVAHMRALLAAEGMRRKVGHRLGYPKAADTSPLTQ